MSGFKAFILKGNLIEIATGLIMALAFAAVVTTFTEWLTGLLPVDDDFFSDKVGRALHQGSRALLPDRGGRRGPRRRAARGDPRPAPRAGRRGLTRRTTSHERLALRGGPFVHVQPPIVPIKWVVPPPSGRPM